MRTIILSVQYTALAVSALSLIFLLFALGHTETVPLAVTLAIAFLASTGALVAGVIYWAGVPPPEKKQNSGKS